MREQVPDRRPGRARLGVELDDALLDRDLRGAGDERLGHRRQREPLARRRRTAASTPDGPTTAAAADLTGQSAIASSAGTRSSLVGAPRREDRCHMPGVRAAAAAEHRDGGQSVTQCGVPGAEVDRVALVELGRLVELGMAPRRRVRPQADEPLQPRPIGCQRIREVGGVRAVDHEIRGAGAGLGVHLLDRFAQRLARREADRRSRP